MINENDFTRINRDVNGNPRYVCHFIHIADDYTTAVERANTIGGRKYQTKRYGGGIVFQTYSLRETCNQINELLFRVSA